MMAVRFSECELLQRVFLPSKKLHVPGVWHTLHIAGTPE